MKSSRLIPQQKSSASVLPRDAELLSPLVTWIVSSVVGAVVFAVYSPALSFQFILDDHRFVGDPRLQSAGHVWEYFTTYVWAQIPGGLVSFYRPFFIL